MMKKVARESAKRRSALPALISVAAGLSLQAAQAQDMNLVLEEVVVTAQKRAESSCRHG